MAKSHPTYNAKEKEKEYDEHRNPIHVEGKSPVVHDKKWREETAKEFYERYGHWYSFQGTKNMSYSSNNYKPTWLSQYRKEV